MSVSYDKLFKLLIDKKIKKGELCRIAGVSTTSLAKLAKGENVNTDILAKICVALNCEWGDVAEVINDNENQQ